eukprot:CAMPEP_0171067028 /NCGR_PEP_ID=MMETSP0766_2-20121228/7759_1 /TAXON_ID=439317 /ORGANISM="Gambierdiscus australes, Strain CAWD 149" /LENGTH=263 /DNA_ID=CAMNT_0011523237 /DNA_START=46 /DNA_END=838 /DNA_ORIENTATION=-
MTSTPGSSHFAFVGTLLVCASADVATPVRDGCHKLLRDIAARGYGDVELAAYCRASLPPQVCRNAFNALGSQPWAPERIGVACQKWEEDAHGAAPGREAVSYEDYVELQRRVDLVMQHKAEAGLCKDPSTGSAIPLDKCVEWKLQEYPKYTQKVQEAIQKIFAAATTGQTPQVQSKAEVVSLAPASRANLSFLVGSAMFVVFVAGVAVTLQRLRRHSKNPEHKHSLVRRSPEKAEDDDDRAADWATSLVPQRALKNSEPKPAL